MATLDPSDPRPRFVTRAYAWIVVWLSPLVVAACLAGTAATYALLPSISAAPAASIGDLLPQHPSALRTETLASRLFRFPVLTPYVVVQRSPHGLSPAALADAYGVAVRVTTHAHPRLPLLAGAAPVANTLGLFPGAHEHGTTVVTYLFFRHGVTTEEGYRESQAYASLLGPRDDTIGVTGAFAARIEQYREIHSNLHLVEIATVSLIVVIIGLALRAVLAPLLVVGTAAIAFVSSQRLLGWVSQRAGLSMPRELTAVAVVLMLGVVTDYSVFFLVGTRRRLAAGERRTAAVRRTAESIAPIILTAGLVVACGVATLAVGTLGFLRSFGPGMAITVATGLVMSLTFVPAVLALLGPAVFWPGLRREALSFGIARARLARAMQVRPVAWLVTVLVVAVLVAAATGVTRLALGLTLVGALPADNPAARAGTAAREGFSGGILGPTEVIVRLPDIAARRAALRVLQQQLSREPHVSSVLGPAQEPSARRLGIFLAAGGGAARYLVVFDSEPTEAPAVAALEHLQRRMPALLARARLGGARVDYGGETALSVDADHAVVTSIWRIALVAFAVNAFFLIVFLRALVAPLYLLLASALVLAATFGLTAYLFQGLFGWSGITYYIPIAIGVLLVSLGSDYNLFVVGRIWQEARRRPLREAVRSAAPRTGRAISVAGVAMAFSFALLALVPLRPFRVFAFAMAAGILLDSLLVRSILVPSLIVAFGRFGYWPRRPPDVLPEGDAESFET